MLRFSNGHFGFEWDLLVNLLSFDLIFFEDLLNIISVLDILEFNWDLEVLRKKTVFLIRNWSHVAKLLIKLKLEVLLELINRVTESIQHFLNPGIVLFVCDIQMILIINFDNQVLVRVGKHCSAWRVIFFKSSSS
jgi:hypothetical protein